MKSQSLTIVLTSSLTLLPLLFPTSISELLRNQIGLCGAKVLIGLCIVIIPLPQYASHWYTHV